MVSSTNLVPTKPFSKKKALLRHLFKSILWYLYKTDGVFTECPLLEKLHTHTRKRMLIKKSILTFCKRKSSLLEKSPLPHQLEADLTCAQKISIRNYTIRAITLSNRCARRKKESKLSISSIKFSKFAKLTSYANSTQCVHSNLCLIDRVHGMYCKRFVCMNLYSTLFTMDSLVIIFTQLFSSVFFSS